MTFPALIALTESSLLKLALDWGKVKTVLWEIRGGEG
jgi:hypothetical protein